MTITYHFSEVSFGPETGSFTIRNTLNVLDAEEGPDGVWRVPDPEPEPVTWHSEWVFKPVEFNLDFEPSKEQMDMYRLMLGRKMVKDIEEQAKNLFYNASA